MALDVAKKVRADIASRSKAQHITTARAGAPLRPTPPRAEAARGLPLPSAAPELGSSCALSVERIQMRYKALRQIIPPGTLLSDNPLVRVLSLSPKACDSPLSRAETWRILHRGMDTHSGRIGLILPLSGQRAGPCVEIVRGMRAAFQEAGMDFEKSVVLKDSGNTVAGAEVQLAELLFKDQVELVAGGFDHGESEVLAQWGASLSFPTLLLSPKRDLASLSPSIFVLYPDEKRLADLLARAAMAKGKKRVAILRPTGKRSEHLTAYFKEAMTAQGGVITADLSYTPNSFQDMQNATKQLFKIDSPERVQELRDAFLKAQQKAEEDKVPFSPKEVLLPPIVDFDALFLPDDFRAVRHFSKLFKYHMVGQLTLIGNHEWRSVGLIDPPDESLTGSFFADFIGSYASLSPSLNIPPSTSPWFIDPDSVARVDYSLIGYRTGKVLTALLEQRQPRRSLVPSLLSSISWRENQTAPMQPVFDTDRMALWPTHIFSLQKNQLILEPDFQRIR